MPRGFLEIEMTRSTSLRLDLRTTAESQPTTRLVPIGPCHRGLERSGVGSGTPNGVEPGLTCA